MKLCSSTRPRAAVYLAFILGLSVASSATAKTVLYPGVYARMQDAISAAEPGDTIQVAPGEYVEKFTMKNGIVLRSANGPDSTRFVSPGGSPELVLERLIECPGSVDSSTVIEGFTFDHGGHSGVGIFCDAASPTIRGNVFRGFGWGIYLRESNALVEKNTIEQCSAFGILISASSPRIHSNELRHNLGAAIEISGKKSFPVIGGSREHANRIYANGFSVRNGSRNEIDATYNDWGWETTEEMKRKSYPSDIIAIGDGNDFARSHRGRGAVNYQHWIESGESIPPVGVPASVTQTSQTSAEDSTASPGESAPSTPPATRIPRWIPVSAALVLAAVFVAAARRKKPNAPR